MTVQEVKAVLNSVRIKYREYELAQEKALRFRSTLTGAAQVMTDIPQSTKNENSREKGYLKLVEYSEDAAYKFRNYLAARESAEKLISALNDHDEQEVLTRRYIMFEKWENIAGKMYISDRKVFYLRRNGMRKISESLQ
jgi:hypothetical protein